MNLISFFFPHFDQVSALYGLNGTGQGRGLLKWDYDGKIGLLARFHSKVQVKRGTSHVGCA